MTKPTFKMLSELHNQAGGDAPRVTRENLQEFLRNPDRRAAQFPSEAIAAKYGFTVEADVKPHTFEIKDVELVLFLEKGDKGSVIGKVLRGRAIILEANFGLVDGQYMLDNQDEIPVVMRDYHNILTGTFLRDADGRLFVPCLRWHGGCWVLYFGWVGYGFNGNDRLARSNK